LTKQLRLWFTFIETKKGSFNNWKWPEVFTFDLLFGEFDPGSGLTLYGPPLAGSGERLSNAWIICPSPDHNLPKGRLIVDGI